MPRALVLHSGSDGVHAAVEGVDTSSLPEGDVLVDVLYSSLNYKDALAVTGRGKVVRGDYPFVPGIDLVGRVRTCTSKAFREGDLVLGTGWGLGESTWGGYAEVQRVQSSWLVPLPEALSPAAAMVAGTAGLTAMLAAMMLERHGVSPGSGAVLVTGASGGVGSLAVAILSGLGHTVHAATGSPDTHPYLKRLGASKIVARSELDAGAARPLDSAEWAGAVDVVGGRTLEAVISRLGRHGVVAACGLAGGHELHTTVFPFILRGVSLIGIDSNTCPNDVRLDAWRKLSERLSDDLVETIRSSTITLEDVPAVSRELLDGNIRGRIVVDVNA